MKLYDTAGTPNPDRVTFFLKEKGLLGSVERVHVELGQGEHKKPAFKALNPLARVPVLELDDGTIIAESRAICTYFEGVYPEPNLMGGDPKEKAIIEMWDRRVELQLMSAIAGWYRHGHPSGVALEPVQCEEWSEICEENTDTAADFFDDHLGESEYVAGDRFTIADISLYVCMRFGRYMKVSLWEDRENLSRWMEQMKARPMAQK